MWRAVASLVCAVLVMALPAPALAQIPVRQLAVVLKDRIVAVNEDGTGLRPLYTPGSGDPITGPAWSPDGNKLAFAYQDKINVLDLTARSVTSITTPGVGNRDVDPAWLADGTIGFRRIRTTLGILESQTRQRVSLGGSVGAPRPLDILASALALTSNIDVYAVRLGDALLWSGSDLELVIGAADTPAWSADATKLAYVDGGSVWGSGLRFRTFSDTPQNFKVADLPAAAPRWAPDGSALAFVRDGQVMKVPAREGAASVAVPRIAGATAVDWQPCTAATTVNCRSVLAPTCSATTAQVTTLTDQPVELPAAPCTDPAGLPLQLVLVKDGDHGSVSGSVYAPRPGFVGQDSVTYRVSNGSAVSEIVRVTIFVVPRPAAGGPTPSTNNPPATAAAPFLSARVKPALDRKRTTLARLACDQACSFTVRLEGTLRGKKKPFRGKALKRTLTPDRVLALRLKLPAKPKGTLKTVFITGTVRGANGATRPVKLAVSVRR